MKTDLKTSLLYAVLLMMVNADKQQQRMRQTECHLRDIHMAANNIYAIIAFRAALMTRKKYISAMYKVCAKYQI